MRLVTPLLISKNPQVQLYTYILATKRRYKVQKVLSMILFCYFFCNYK